MIKKTIYKGFFETLEIQEIDRKQFANLLTGLFQNITLNEFVQLITNKYKSCIEYGKLINGERINSQMSLLFNPHRLDTHTNSSKKLFLIH